MIPSFKPGILSSNKIRIAAVPPTPCVDCTPNAVNFSSSIGASPMTNYEVRRFTGIDGFITVKFTYGSGFRVYARTFDSATEGTFSSASAPSVFGTLVLNNGTIDINPNQYLRLAADSLIFGDIGTLTLINQSGGNTTIDTVDMYYGD